MFRLVARSIRGALALASLGALALARPPQASSQSGTDAWRPQTVPLWGASYSPDIGLLVGAGITHTRYGFRALPASTRLLAEAAYASSVHSFRLDLAGEFRRPLFPAMLFVELRASGLERTRFYGTGNETDGSRPDSVYRVRQTQLLLQPRVAIPLAPRFRLTLGPLLDYTHTPVDAGTVLALARPYGAGGTAVSGTVPFQELVYVGGETTVRGYAEQRFAGRRGAYGNVELRFPAGRLPFADVGLFGLADAGRVWTPGEASDRWHAAAGGGLWLAWQHRRATTLSVAVARSPERTAVYVRAGFMF